MELNDRKRAILAAIIKAHIITGEPVGSKSLCEMFDFGLSSATLRNEMSDLCALGFLEQPHTSAGRVPSSQGYKVYVNHLLGNGTVSDEMRRAIDNMFENISSDPEYIPTEATKMLADLTGLTAITTTAVGNFSKVSRVELLPMGHHTVLLALITSDGVARNRVCRSNAVLTPQLLSVFERLISAHIEGALLTSLTPAYMQTVVSYAGADAFSIISLMSALFAMVGDIRRSVINVSGESNLFTNLKDDAEAGRLLEYMTRSDALLSLISKNDSPISIMFGSDTEIDVLKPSCLVFAKYGADSNATGRIGVIGPRRMAYDDVIPSIGYFALKLGNAMSEALKDMEEI